MKSMIKPLSLTVALAIALPALPALLVTADPVWAQNGNGNGNSENNGNGNSGNNGNGNSGNNGNGKSSNAGKGNSNASNGLGRDRAPGQIKKALRERLLAAPHLIPSDRGGPSFKSREITAVGVTGDVRAKLEQLGFRILTDKRLGSLRAGRVMRLRTPANLPPAAALKIARNLTSQARFDLSHLYRPALAEPEYGPRMIGYPADERLCRARTRIGLIDTAVARHPALNRTRVRVSNFVKGYPGSSDPTHGTAVASILIGKNPGTGPLTSDATLYSANVFYREGGKLRSDAAAIIEAIDWMVKNRVRVVNMSLMGAKNDLLAEAISRAAAKGVIFVAAAGNNGPKAPPSYPAAYKDVIAVSAIDRRGRAYTRNNRGRFVEFSAPGVEIWAARAGGGEAFWTGTSFAAPFVTAALAHGVADGIVSNVNNARQALRRSARDLGARGRDPVYGWGLVQAPGGKGC